MALGLHEDAAWQTEWVQIEHGGLLVLYSDGVVEAQGSKQELFGQERLEALIRHGGQEPAREARQQVRAVIAALQAFAGEEAQSDDITLVIIRRKLERQEPGPGSQTAPVSVR
jgi:sigma-B regulation protein RsbU (phosphoserine phosphatase)